MYTIKWLMRLCGLLMVLMLLLTASQASAQALHGTDGEKQVMGEMKARLGKALTTGDVSACQREGGNLARYGIGAQGEALIATDMASVQRRLDAIKLVYKSHYDLRTLNNKKSVKQAFKLISKLQDKLTEDALDDVSMVFVPAHSVSSKIALELYIAAKDVYGHNSDAGELVDSAKALKELDRLVKNSDEKMKKMIPEAKNLERVRTFLIDCHAAYKKGAGGANAAPGQSGQSGATFTAEKGAADSWSHIRVTVGNVTNFKTEDRPGWRNNGTGFTAVSADSGSVTIKIDIIGKGGVSYFDYISSVSVKTSDGKILIAEQPVISKDGGNKSFSVVWDPAAKPGGVSIEIKIMGGNPEYFSYFVSGALGAGQTSAVPVAPKPQPRPTPTPTTNTKPVTALAGTWSCSDGGTYQIKQSGTSIKWEAASADGGRTWAHTFVGTIQGDKIVGRFEDHPPGRYTNRGDLTLRIVGGSKLEFVSASVPFGGRVWSR